jgi:alcohol dehydrogenase
MSRRVKAYLFHGPGQPMECREVSLRPLQAGELRVRMRLCTLCGSDLHTYFGRRGSPLPCILGHEMLGIVEEIHSDSVPVDLNGESMQIGDRLISGVAVSCGRCFFCTRDLPQKCEQLLKYGHHVQDDSGLVWGGLAQEMILLNGTAMVKVPLAVPDRVAAPAGCATATVAAMLAGFQFRGDETVLILGAGMLGCTAAAMCKWRGASRVVVLDRDQLRLQQASRFGAETGSLPERGVDLALELTGSVEMTQQGIDSLRTGGQMVLAGAVFPTPPISIHPEMLIRRSLQIRGVHNYRPADLLKAIQFLEATHEQYPFAELVAREFPFEEVESGFEHAERERPHRVGVRLF